MISIVVCHRKAELLDRLKPNIESTIGINHELIVIDNRNNPYTIFEAYNLGVAKSKNEILCFMHEDIMFHTEKWGVKVLNHFNEPSIGMIGVIGANVFPISPSPWWSNQLINDHLVNNIQHWQNSSPKTNYQQVLPQSNSNKVTRQYNNPTKENVVEAVVVDGLWFCIRKKLFDEKNIKFDEDLFRGFHCYDSDISLQVKQQARVCIVFDILMEHFQQGNINTNWFESVILLNRKWRDSLPIVEKKIDKENYSLYEWETLRTFIYWMQSNGYSENKIRELLLEICPLLPLDAKSKPISTELIYRAKYTKNISRIITLLYKLLS